MADIIKVFGFAPDWGLPTTGPFALKLLTWMQAHNIRYEFHTEMNSGKGPKGKSPWIKIGDKIIADSNDIIAHLAKTHHIDLSGDMGRPQVANAYALQVAFEERMHQILEWELFCTNEGLRFIRQAIKDTGPPILDALIYKVVVRNFQKQLYARGISRHDNAKIFELGEELVLALETFLIEGGFARTDDKPSIAEAGVYGQVGLMAHWPMQTPVANRIKKSKPIKAWVQDIGAHYLATNTSPSQTADPVEFAQPMSSAAGE